MTNQMLEIKSLGLMLNSITILQQTREDYISEQYTTQILIRTDRHVGF